MSHQTLSSPAFKIAIIAIFTSLTTATTMMFSIYVPQTRGFFNIGESMVYTAALLFGPLVGSISGGVGSMLADLLLGFPYYAPATLLIKAVEGGVTGFLGLKTPKFQSSFNWKIFTFLTGLVVGITLAAIGALYYSGIVEFSIGIPPPSTPNIVFYVPPQFWYVIGALVVLLITLSGFKLEPELGWSVFTMLIGGATMVTGYYLYQRFVLYPLFGIEVLALAEIPVNIGQMLIGLVIALPVVRIVRRSFPQLKK
ncbi:ECF transporter S component [Candidatus Bathyarchaeota archaeon]|nr:ECF transporter S component [Candidatus Bathyarchaeota archaeon]